MTDKQITKPRPICLYEDTCLHLKEKTRLCEDCVHHKNYWSELLEKEQVEKIKSLEQECEELKKGYAELTNIVAHYMDDFTGYNEESGGFDIILCVKELLEQAERQHQGDKGLITSTGKQNYQLIQEYDKLKNCLTEIKEIAEPYKIIIKKVCGNCKKYDDCHACCYKDTNCYKYTSPKTNACEEFTYLDKFVPNILANSILQKISEVEE